MSMSATVRTAIEKSGLKVRHMDGYTRNGARRFNARAALGTKSASAVEKSLRANLDITRFVVKGKTVRLTAIL